MHSQEEAYYLQLLSPTSWETIPHSKYVISFLLSSPITLSHTLSLSLPPSLLPSLSLSLLFLLRHEMEAHYQVTDMKVMRLRSQETLSGRKEFIVVGTMATFGEEVSTKGKVCNYALL